MQASKVVPGKQYAVKSGIESGFVAFIVDEVITTRKARKSNAVTTVAGRFADGPDRERKVFDIEALEGPVEEYAALVEERRRKEAEQAAKREARKALTDTAARLLGEKIGVPWTGDRYSGDAQVSSTYGGIDITFEALPALIDYLEHH